MRSLRRFHAAAVFAALVSLAFTLTAVAAEIECAEFDESGDVKTEQKTVENDVKGAQTQVFGIDAKEGGEKLKGIQQKSPWTHEDVKIKDGKMQIVSTCGEKGKTGTVTICIMQASGKEICGIKIPKDKGTLIDSALGAATSRNPGSAMQRLAMKTMAAELGKINPQQLKTYFPPAFQKLLTDAGFSSDYLPDFQQSLKDDPRKLPQFLEALASGDDHKLKDFANDTSRQVWAKSSGLLSADPRALYDGAKRMYAPGLLDELPEGVREGLLSNSNFCGVFGSECPAYDAPPTMRHPAAGFDEPPAPSFRSLASQPMPVTSGGKVDPVAFYAHAVKAAREGGLDGYIEPRLQRMGLLTTGSAEEWGRLYTMMAKQESGFSIYSTNPGECSHGILQFCPGEYGLRTMGEVRNPELALQAVIKVTQQGQLSNYFGPLKRQSYEVPQWASWFEKSVAPYADGAVPYTPIARGVYADIADRAGRAAPDTYGGLLGYGSAFGSSGSSGLLGGLIQGISSLFGFLTQKNAQQPNAPVAQPPQVAPAQPVQGPIVKPTVRLTVNMAEVQKGRSVTLIWSAAGVASSPPCTLYEGKDGARAALRSANGGTFVKDVPASFSGSSIAFSLECTPADLRAAKEDAIARLEIPVK